MKTILLFIVFMTIVLGLAAKTGNHEPAPRPPVTYSQPAQDNGGWSKGAVFGAIGLTVAAYVLTGGFFAREGGPKFWITITVIIVVLLAAVSR